MFFLKLNILILFASEGNMTTNEQKNKENIVHAVRVKGDCDTWLLCRFGKRNTHEPVNTLCSLIVEESGENH